MGLTRPTRMVAIVATAQHQADPGLHIAIIIVVGDEQFAKAVDGGHVVVAEVVGQQLEVLAVGIAAPDGAGAAVCTVGVMDLALAVAAFQIAHAGVTDAEIEAAIRPKENAMDPMIVIKTAKAGEQLFGWPVSLAIAIGIFQHQQVGRLTEVHRPAWSPGSLGHGNAQRAHQFRALIKSAGSFSAPIAIGVGQDDYPVALLAKRWLVAEFLPVVDRLADPHPPQVVDIHRRGVDAFGFGGKQGCPQTIRHLQGCHRFFRGRLPQGYPGQHHPATQCHFPNHVRSPVCIARLARQSSRKQGQGLGWIIPTRKFQARSRRHPPGLAGFSGLPGCRPHRKTH